MRSPKVKQSFKDNPSKRTGVVTRMSSRLCQIRVVKPLYCLEIYELDMAIKRLSLSILA